MCSANVEIETNLLKACLPTLKMIHFERENFSSSTKNESEQLHIGLGLMRRHSLLQKLELET